MKSRSSSERFPGPLSLAIISPNVLRLILPVSFTARSGSTIERVVTAAIAVLKISAPSRKNGRFSANKIWKRWLVLTRHVTQRFERNCYFDRPPVGAHYAFRLQHDVRIEIFVIISPDTVGLHAQRIEIKFVCLAAVVESVEQDPNVIVVKDVISLG